MEFKSTANSSVQTQGRRRTLWHDVWFCACLPVHLPLKLSAPCLLPSGKKPCSHLLSILDKWVKCETEWIQFIPTVDGWLRRASDLVSVLLPHLLPSTNWHPSRCAGSVLSCGSGNAGPSQLLSSCYPAGVTEEHHAWKGHQSLGCSSMARHIWDLDVYRFIVFTMRAISALIPQKWSFQKRF